jgi:hypothetical protein
VASARRTRPWGWWIGGGGALVIVLVIAILAVTTDRPSAAGASSASMMDTSRLPGGSRVGLGSVSCRVIALASMPVGFELVG